ncbi:hypothetical protein ACYST8_05875 [Pseudomonas inefficax]
MDKFADQDSNDQHFRDMFNIPDAETEGNFALLRYSVVFALVLTVPMAILAMIEHLVG